jgi:hypothetical protein
MRHVHVLRLFFLAAALTTQSCKLPVGEEHKTDPDNGTGTTKDWSFTMSLAHNNFTVAQNATDTNIVTFTRVGGFTGPINLEVMNPDSGVVITSEPITATGAITTTRLMTHANGPHQPFPSAIYNLHAAPVSTEVAGAFADVHFSIVRKDGTFINAPTSMSVARGQAFQQRISIIRTNYNAPVPFVLALFNNAPAGITATFSPNPVTDTVTQMILSVDASVPEGTYSIGVRDNEGTTFQGTAPVTLTVTPLLPPGTIALSTAINPLAVPKNTTVPAGISLTRTNYSGPVTVTATGVPAGVTAAYPGSVSGNSFSISFTNNATGTPGSYPITITISGPGLTSVSLILTINVS